MLSRPRQLVRRSVLVASAVVFAALVAAGCGGDGGGDGGSGETGLVGDEGPLAWLPQDTWIVAAANLDPKAIDDAVTALDRLPIWALAEGFLPASDGKGLRRELFEQLAKETATGEDSKPKVTAKQLEAAFGTRAGFAITSADMDAFDDEDEEDAPVAAWIEVDDEDTALTAVKALFEGSEPESEHEGVTYYEAKDAEATFLVRDGLLVVSTSPRRMEALIDVRQGDDSLAGDETAAAVLEAGMGDALIGFAIASEPLLEAAPKLVRAAAEESTDDEDATQSDKDDAAKAKRIADELGPLLQSNSVDGLIPNWVGGSMTIDTTGLRLRGAWSNPHELADPKVGSRELVERMPADAPVVNATVSDGTMLRRVQDAWADVRDAYDLDLRELVGDECPATDRWACDLGIELALTMLEDENLADALEDQGDTATVMTQDVSSALTSLASAATPGAAARPKALTAPLYEIASTAGVIEVEPNADLVRAATAAGLLVSTSDDGLTITFRVRPGSPMARLLARELDATDAAMLRSLGIDLAALQSPKGLSITADEVDGVYVAGFPTNVPSKVVPALEGDVDTLGDSDVYQDVVKAAKVPDEVGTYGFVNLKVYVETILTSLSGAQGGSAEIQRIIPTVRNNLADVPGIVTWSAREEVDGEEVGVVEVSMPILE